jgi:hypothetical protein
LIQSIIDLQDKIRKTGTLTGREFRHRVQPEGPLPVPIPPAAAVVAPGNYETATRLREN